MKLSIIIVNYNVKYFLEQCLCSVKKASEQIDTQVIVVDNNSTDGSMDYLQPRFPWVEFILNKTNEGFSKANNTALLQVKSKYVLFLNPDTLVAEDSLVKCISFMESHLDAGTIGVKMINGRGEYLKESKRGFPSPWASFCKLFGLTALFPQAKFFSGYYLGFLSENENQLIDAVSGAFMFIRNDALIKAGGFDEQFFMYAEDIDLSYRIQQCGYKNYYFAETAIIHFKGESTTKDFRYVKQFYKAMSQFAKKHFPNSSVFLIILDAAIWARGFFSAIKNLIHPGRPGEKDFATKVFLIGDEKSKAEVYEITNAKETQIIDEKTEADAVIFCEGENFSFKEIINSLSQPHKKSVYKLHGYKSNSLVGSD